MIITEERQRMIQEAENFRERQERMIQAMSEVKVGQLRKQRRQEEEETDRLRNLRFHVRKRNQQTNSAVTIQRNYRGHIGRKAARMWSDRKLRMKSQHALYIACSTTISRYWRGYKGRQNAKDMRREMAEFIVAMRRLDLEAEREAAIQKPKRRSWWSHLFFREV